MRLIKFNIKCNSLKTEPIYCGQYSKLCGLSFIKGIMPRVAMNINISFISQMVRNDTLRKSVYGRASMWVCGYLMLQVEYRACGYI